MPVESTIIPRISARLARYVLDNVFRGDTARSYDEILQETLERGVPGGRLRDNEPLLDRRDIARGGRPVVTAPVPRPPQVIPRPGTTVSGRATATNSTNQGQNDMSIISDLAGVASRYYEYRAARDFMPPQVNTFLGGNDQVGVGSDGLRLGAPAACGTGECGSPRYLTYDCKTGEYKPRRRRRRRKALTKSDMMDLEFVSSLPNTANVKAFLSRLGR